MVAINPSIFRVATEVNRDLDLGPLQTSDEIIQQETENKEFLDNPLMSSTEWYALVTQSNLVPQQREYFYNNTKDIIEPLGLELTDRDIINFLDTNNLRGLDEMIVSAYSKKKDNEYKDQYRAILQNPDYNIYKAEQEIAKLKRQEGVDLDSIATIRSKLAAQILSQKEQEASRPNPVLESLVHKSNRIAQSVAKNTKLRQERSFAEGVGDTAENIGVGATFTRTAMQNTRLAEMGVRNPEFLEAQRGLLKDKTTTSEDVKTAFSFISSTFKDIKDAVMRGSNFQEIADNLMELPDDQFDKVMDMIDNDPLFNSNLLAQAELLGALSGMSNVEANVTDVAEVMNTVTTPAQIKDAGKALSKKASLEWKKEKEVKAAFKQAKKDAQKTIQDLDYTDIVPQATRTVPDIKPEDVKQAILVSESGVDEAGRFRIKIATIQKADGTYYNTYKYLDTLDDVVAEMKKNPSAIFQGVPATDKTKSGVTVYKEMYEDVKQAKDYPEFSLAGDWSYFKGVLRDNDAKIKAASRAYADGSNIQGDLNTGARTAATEKLANKINNSEPLTQQEAYATIPEMAAGAKRNTVANSRLLDSINENADLLEQSLVEKILGPGITPEKLDPKAFEAIRNNLNETMQQEIAWAKKQKLDLKFNKLETVVDPEGQGVYFKEVYGYGKDGNSPIKGLTKEEVDGLIKNSGFKTVDINGDTWLTREGFVPYNSNVATMVDDTKVGTIKPYLVSPKASGLDEDIVNNLYLTTASRAGARDTIETMLRPSLKKLTKQDKKILDSIYNEEWFKNRLLTKEEIFSRAGFADGNAENIYDAVVDMRKVEKLNETLANRSLYNIEKRAGYKQYQFKGHVFEDIPEFNQPFRAVKIDTPDLSKSFYGYVGPETAIGSVVKPSMRRPFESLDDVDVYRLLEPIYTNTYDQIDFIVMPKNYQGVTVSELPLRVLGHQVHAGTRYADNYFISFPRMAKNSDGAFIAYTKTIGTAKTRKQAEAFIEKWQEISDVFKRVKAEEITVGEADDLIQQIALRGPYTLSGDFSTYSGIQEFLTKYKAEDLVTGDVARKLSVRRDSYSPWDALQVPGSPNETIQASNLASRYHKRGEPLVNFGLSSGLVETENFTDYISSTIAKVSTISQVDPVMTTLAERFLATYGNMIDPKLRPNNAMDFLRDPRRYVNRLAQTADTKYHEMCVFSDTVMAALQQRRMDTKGNILINKLLTKLTKSSNPAVSSLGELLYDKNPSRALQGFLYKTTFSFRADQLFLQTALTTIESAGALPVDTTRGGAAFYTTLELVNRLRKGEDISSYAKILEGSPTLRKFWPEMTAADLQSLAENLRRQGVAVTVYNDIRGNNILTKSSSALMAPFNKGNEYAKVLGYLTAASRRSREIGKPISKFNVQDWGWVSTAADGLSGGSSAANIRPILNTSITRPLTMMSAFPLNQWETYVIGDGLHMTTTQKLKWIGLMTLLYGTETFVDAESAREFGMMIEDKTQSELLGKISAVGLYGAILSKAAGYDIDASSSTPELFNIVYINWAKELLNKDEDSRPFMVNALRLIGVKGSTAWEFLSDPEEGALPEFKKLSPGNKAVAVGRTLMRIFPGLAEAERVWYAAKYDEYINRQGIDLLSNHDPRERLLIKTCLEMLTGMKPAEETGLNKTVAKNYKKSLEEDYRQTLTLATKYMTLAYKEELRGHTDLAKQNLDIAQHTLAIGLQDIPSDAKEDLLIKVNNNSMRALSETELNELLQRSSPFTRESPALQRYYNQQAEKYQQ